MPIPQGMKYDGHGLLCAVVQDADNGEVLMQAFMNEEALRLTLETGVAHFFSRSRGRLWKKGESSGHLQQVREVRVDCDQDAVLLKVTQAGGACHEGYRSCFYRTVAEDGTLRVSESRVFDPKSVYRP